MRALAIAAALALAGCATTPVATSPTVAAPAAAPRAQALAMLEAAMAEHGVPGLSVAVYRDDRMVLSEALGVANMELDAPATPNTLFRTGSIAKAVTGSIAARMAARGEIDLDRPVGEYLPDWPAGHPPITLRQLLGHLGGIRHYTAEDRDTFGKGSIDFALYPNTASALAIFKDDPLVAPPGESFNYSTFGFTLVGAVLEAASGKSFAQLLHDEVTAPTGIADIRLDSFLTVVPNRASFYDRIPASLAMMLPSRRVPGASDYMISLPLNSSYKYAGGGMIATADALARFGALHFAPGFLPPGIYAETMTRQRDAAGEPTGTGLAWWVQEDAAGRRFIGHTGSQQGAFAMLAVYPQERVSIAIMTNLGPDGLPISELGADIAALYMSAP